MDPHAPDQHAPFVAAVHALARARDDRGEWREVVRMTDLRLTAARTDAERIAVLHETASHWEKQGGDLCAAFDATLRAFEIAPSAELATELRRLVGPAQRHAVLAERLPAALASSTDLPASSTRDLFWDLARHFRDTAHDASHTEQALRRALAAEPTNVLLSTELCDALRATGAPSRPLVDALLALAGLVEPIAPLREAAAHASEALHDVALTREVTERLLEAALARFPAPGDAAGTPPTAESALSPAGDAARWAFHTLIGIAREAGDAARVVSLGERAASLPFAASDRRAFRIAAAENASPDHAIGIYTELFDRDATDGEVAQRLFDLHEARGDRDALIAIRGQQIDNAGGPMERGRLRLDLARRLADANRGDAAVEVLRTSLSENPGDEPTTTALGERLAADGRYPDLATLWEEEATRRETAGDRDGAATLWTRAAVVAEGHLRDTLREIGRAHG